MKSTSLLKEYVIRGASQTERVVSPFSKKEGDIPPSIVSKMIVYARLLKVTPLPDNLSP